MEKKTTKDALIEAALEQVAIGGFSQLSLRKVASAVNVTATTIYRHFRNKEQLEAAILKLLKSRLKTGLYEGLENKTTQESFFIVLKNLTFMLIKRRAFLSLKTPANQEMASIHDPAYMEDLDILERWHGILRTGIKGGWIKPLPLYQLDALTIKAMIACISDPAFEKETFDESLFIECLWQSVCVADKR